MSFRIVTSREVFDPTPTVPNWRAGDERVSAGVSPVPLRAVSTPVVDAFVSMVSVADCSSPSCAAVTAFSMIPGPKPPGANSI